MNHNTTLKIGLCNLIMLVIGLAQPVIYVDPPRIPAKTVGEQCTLKVRVRNAAGIYGWQIAAIYFNPDVLEGVSVAEDSFLKYAHGVNHSTWWSSQSFDNVNGYLDATLCIQAGVDSGGVGDGPLMKVIFKVKGTGSSMIDFAFINNIGLKTYVLNTGGYSIPLLCVNGFYGDENIPPTSFFPINTEADHQIRPTIAWNSNANEFLAIWEGYSVSDGSSVIQAQRVSSTGSLLGEFFTIEGDGFFNAFMPSVSWNGTSYLVTYTRRFLGTLQGNYDIVGNTVSESDSVGDAFTICTASRYQGNPVIAWNSSNHLVVWEDYRNGWDDPDIYGQRISPNGTLIGSNFRICEETSVSLSPRIASDGSNYLVIWTMAEEGSHAYGSIYGQRVDANGNLIDSLFLIASTGSMPDIAWDGTNYLIVYQKPSGASAWHWDIYAQRVSSAGALVGQEFAINTASNDQTMPRVIYEMASGKYLVNWVSEQSMPAIWRQAVNTNGTLFNGPSVQADASYQQIFPALAYGGSTGDMIVWADMRNGSNFDIYGYKQILIGVEENALRSTLNALCLEIHPNPFSTLTNISFGKAQGVEGKEKTTLGTMPLAPCLRIYDATGRLIRQFDYPTIGQSNRITWHGDDDFGHKLPAGIYFVQLSVNPVGEMLDKSVTKKVIKLK